MRVKLIVRVPWETMSKWRYLLQQVKEKEGVMVPEELEEVLDEVSRYCKIDEKG
jgi:hypothetical protein